MQLDKPILSRPEQVSWCTEHGLISNDSERDELDSFLRFVNFSTFVGYWAIYKDRSISANQVMKDFVADQRLRRLVMEAIERIEVAFRTIWSEYLLQFGDPFIYCSSDLFKTNEYQPWFARVAADIGKQKLKNQRIKHFYEKYDEKEYPYPPLWLAVNAFTLGTLSYGIKAVKDSSFKKGAAGQLGLPRNVDFLDSYLRVLTNVRNICAHHDRLWSNPSIGAIKTMKEIRNGRQRTLYPFLKWSSTALIAMSPSTSWPDRVRKHCLSSFEDWQLTKVMAGRSQI